MDCSFVGNQAVLGGRFTAGAVFTSVKKIVIKSTFFENNTAAAGAVSVDANSEVQILNCSIKWNNAKYFSGGAIHTKGQKLAIKFSLFEYNTAKLAGGAVYANLSAVDIKNSSFHENNAELVGGAISANGKQLVIKSSLFKYNTAHGRFKGCSGGAILFNKVTHDVHDDPSSTLQIYNSSFQGNRARWQGGAIYSNGFKFAIKASSFDDNSVDRLGGAIYTTSLEVKISESSFSRNKAIVFGGALYQTGNAFIIKKSNFNSNLVSGKLGQGGAIYTQGLFFHPTYLFVGNISDCLFRGNHASFRGGAIMASTNGLFIQHSSFMSSSYPHSSSYAGRDFLYSRSLIMLENTSFLDADRYNFQSSLIIHETLNTLSTRRKEGVLRSYPFLQIRNGVRIKCFTGRNISVSTATKSKKYQNKFLFMEVTCSFCSQNSYSLMSAHLESFSPYQDIAKTYVRCYRCPLGGMCERGKIRATNNFWGFVFKDQVHFASCPFGYCCFKKECVNYSSCHTSRTGILCGQCEKGLTENLLTHDCLPHEKCRHQLYWLIVMIIGILYVSVLMHINEITKVLKAFLIPKCFSDYKQYFKRASIKISQICQQVLQLVRSKSLSVFKQGCQMQYLTDDVIVSSAEDEETFVSIQGNVPLICEEEIQSIVLTRKDEGEKKCRPWLIENRHILLSN